MVLRNQPMKWWVSSRRAHTLLMLNQPMKWWVSSRRAHTLLMLLLLPFV